jgi:TrmH family RNA methyltransferase
MHPLDHFIVVLDHPENPTNIGSVVRAMKNMGFHRLRLVAPAPYTDDDLLRMAHRCDDLVAQIERFSNLEEALAEAQLVVGTAAIAHAGLRITQDVRGLATELVQQALAGPIALLFGAEADGLDRAALDRCHLLAMLPANPAYPALNLAQAVLLFLYEIRMAAMSALSIASPPVASLPVASPPPAVTQAQLEQLFAVGEEALRAIDFFRYNPTAVMRTLRQLAYRAALRPDEVALLLAIARRTVRAGRDGAPPKAAPES